MRKVYLLALFVLLVLFLAGCADLVQYDKGYQELDETSIKLAAQGVETHDTPPAHKNEGSDLENVDTAAENLAKNALE